jgi:hypothetical protein
MSNAVSEVETRQVHTFNGSPSSSHDERVVRHARLVEYLVRRQRHHSNLFLTRKNGELALAVRITCFPFVGERRKKHNDLNRRGLI